MSKKKKNKGALGKKPKNHGVALNSLKLQNCMYEIIEENVLQCKDLSKKGKIVFRKEVFKLPPGKSAPINVLRSFKKGDTKNLDIRTEMGGKYKFEIPQQNVVTITPTRYK